MRAAGWGRERRGGGWGASSCCARQHLPPTAAAQRATQEESNLQSWASETPINACIALVPAAGDGTVCTGDGTVCTGDGTVWAQMRVGCSVEPGAALPVKAATIRVANHAWLCPCANQAPALEGRCHGSVMLLSIMWLCSAPEHSVCPSPSLGGTGSRKSSVLRRMNCCPEGWWSWEALSALEAIMSMGVLVQIAANCL